jgi:hypothetical protein
MNEKHTFRSKEEEVSSLLEELAALRELMRDIAKKLTNIETRTKRAFPGVATKRAARRGEANGDPNPTLSAQDALALYDQVVQLAKSGAHEEATDRVAQQSLPDLVVLLKELGLPLGKSKPSKKRLTNAILGRVKQSVMLSQHSIRPRNRDES